MNFSTDVAGLQVALRIPAMYEVKHSKISNFWMFWPVIQLRAEPLIIWGGARAKSRKKKARSHCARKKNSVQSNPKKRKKHKQIP